jgi:hypothetical protein
LPVANGRGGRVIQRFSGSGVAERALTTQRERRARSATIALSVVAVALLISSAIFLFNPFLQNRGFGFALGYRYKTVQSSDVLKIADDPPKVPTPPAGGQPTPTPPGAKPTGTPGAHPTTTPRPVPTATPRPTATPGPTATPTPPIGSAATVKFTATNKTIQSQPASITDCSSGCTINAYQHLANNITENNYSVAATAGPVATQTLQGYLWVAHVSGGPNPAYATLTLSSGGVSCTVVIGNPNGLATGTAETDFCNTGVYSPLTDSSFAGSLTGATCFDGDTPKQYRCNFAWQVANLSQPLTTNPKRPSVSYSDCHNAMDNLAYTQGHDAMSSWVSANTNSGWMVAGSPSYTYGNWNCSPGIGSLASSGTFHAWDTTWVDAYTFDPAAAQNYAMNNLNGQLPTGYVWQNNASGCSLGSSVSGSTVNINCQYSRTAVYDWSLALKDSLAQNLANPSLDATAAANICNNAPGVVPGSCTVTISNGTLMPSNYRAISFTIG